VGKSGPRDLSTVDRRDGYFLEGETRRESGDEKREIEELLKRDWEESNGGETLIGVDQLAQNQEVYSVERAYARHLIRSKWPLLLPQRIWSKANPQLQGLPTESGCDAAKLRALVMQPRERSAESRPNVANEGLQRPS